MPIIDLPPALAYTLAGPADAPVIVFINGLGGAQAAFSLQFKDLSRDFRVLTYDHRGMGASAVVDAPVTMATYAADLLALLDHLGLMRVHLVGLSFGGRVAQTLCLMAPERVHGLVLCGTSAGGRLHVPGEGRAMAALHRGGALTEDDWANELAPALFGAAYRRKYPDRIRFFARWRVKYPTDPVGLARQWEAWRSFDVCDRLHQIAAPTLILHGTDDGISPAENAENLAEAIPGARLQWLPEVGHSPNAEAPELFNGALRSFFAPLG